MWTQYAVPSSLGFNYLWQRNLSRNHNVTLLLRQLPHIHPGPYQYPEHHGWRLGKTVTTLTARLEGNDPNAEQAARGASGSTARAGHDTHSNPGVQKVLFENEEAVDGTKGPSHWTCCLGTSHKYLCSSQLYEGCLCHQA